MKIQTQLEQIERDLELAVRMGKLPEPYQPDAGDRMNDRRLTWHVVEWMAVL